MVSCVYITTERSEFCIEGYKRIIVIQGKNGNCQRDFTSEKKQSKTRIAMKWLLSTVVRN